MKRIASRLHLLLLLFGLCAPDALAGLADDIRAVLRDKALNRVEVGIAISRLDSTAPVVIFQNKSNALFVPASNLKLITTSAALHRLGAEFRFRTYLLLNGNNLILWGDGDPALGDAEMLRAVGWDVNTVFKSWAEQLAKKNVTSVGDIVVDDSVFDEIFLHPNWPADQVHKRYVAEVGGVNLNANCVDFLVQSTQRGQRVGYLINPDTRYVRIANTCLTGGDNAIWLSRVAQTNDIVLRGETRQSLEVPVSVTVHDPPLFAATVLSETLSANGVQVAGQVRRDRGARLQFAEAQANAAHGGAATAGQWSVLAVHETPLATVLARANKDSMNLYAESLCKRLGHAATGNSGSWENGLAAIGQFLTADAGVPVDQLSLDDGSGLSRLNRISPDAIVRVLAFNHASPASKMYMDSLSVAGEDGTLQDRFRGSTLQHRVLAKSGYINGVSSLSGYFQGADQRWYAFSILMNNIPDGSNSMMKAIQERILIAADKYAR